MEELLSKNSYYCKPNSGLKMNCKLISGLINQTVNFFLGRVTFAFAQPHDNPPLDTFNLE